MVIERWKLLQASCYIREEEQMMIGQVAKRVFATVHSGTSKKASTFFLLPSCDPVVLILRLVHPPIAR
jgi:hypothetical protein